MRRTHVKMIQFAILFVLVAGLGMFGAVLAVSSFASRQNMATMGE